MPLLILFCALLCSMARSFGGPSIAVKSIFPFATADRVHIDCVLQSGAAGVAVVDGSIVDPSGQPLWTGELGAVKFDGSQETVTNWDITGLRPRLWSPSTPVLYRLNVFVKTNNNLAAQFSTRLGFRSFSTRDGQLALNGRPVFLRGLAINPPGRTIPAATGESRTFAEAYVRFLKAHHVNIIRLTQDSQVWFDVCDELGMMIYQGVYGAPPGADSKRAPPADVEKSIAAYKDLFDTYARHPSIVIYVLANELPASGSRGKAFHEFLEKAHAALQSWDSTRLYIANAGYGEGREGDICDVHRYWGWYYNTFLTYYNLRDGALFGDPGKNQPITFSECVGNFTAPSGAYNLIVRKQLGAQLNWTGHADNQSAAALAYQSFMVKQAAESFRRLRPINPRLAGLMPFTILFRNWNGISSFAQMEPKPAMEALATAYQPVLLSWELWTPQVYAGGKLHPVAHVVNDADDGAALTRARLEYSLRNAAGDEIVRNIIDVETVPYFHTWNRKLEISIPPRLATGDYVLTGQVIVDGQVVSRNESPVFIAGRNWLPSADRVIRGAAKSRAAGGSSIVLYDPAGRTAKALSGLGLSFHRVSSLSVADLPMHCLVIGADAWDAGLSKAMPELKRFVNDGGRVLCLKQDPSRFDPSWLPEPITFFSASANDAMYPPRGRPFSGNMNINPERPWHPVFRGLDRNRLAMWSDYTGWDETKPGFPRLYPVTAGFKLSNAGSLARTAVLADYDRGLEGIGLCEMFSGKGSVILSGFDLVARAGLDPAADRLLWNLVTFAASATGHEIYPLIQKPIEWGNYATERGVITGPANGLIVNADWVRPATNPNAEPLTQAEGAWNTRPGDEFAPHGRRIFGPYGYSTSSSLREKPASDAIGRFWARIPSGTREMTTTVENRSKGAQRLTIFLDGKIAANESVPTSGVVNIQTPITAGSGSVAVMFEGSPELVLLSTRFK